MANETISANDFVTKFNITHTYVKETNYRVQGIVNFKPSNFRCNGATIEDCIFEDGVFFDDLSIRAGVFFRNSKFHKNLSFNSVKISGANNHWNIFSENLTIDNCEIQSILSFPTECSFERGIKIINTKIADIKFSHLNITENGGIYFENSSISSKLDVSHLRICGEFRLHKCTLDSNVRFEDNNASNISFTKSKFKSNLFLWGGKLKQGITFNNGIYEDDVSIQAVGASGTLTFSGDQFQKSCLIRYYDNNTSPSLKRGCKKIYIDSTSYQNGLLVEGSSEKSDLYSIDEVSIPITNKLVGAVELKNFDIKEIKLSGSNFNANIAFNNILVQNIDFHSFSNYSNIQLVDFRAKSTVDSAFSVRQSYLGRFQLLNVDLESFATIELHNSHLYDIIASNVNWFTDKKLKLIPVLKKNKLKKLCYNLLCIFKNEPLTNNLVENAISKQEVFRQLKVAMEKNGNRIDALKFKQLEMLAYESSLKLRRRAWNLDYIIMWTNKSNNHGENWFRPILISIAFTLLFYAAIIVSIDKTLIFRPSLSIDDINYTLDIFSKHYKVLWQLFNPVRLLGRILPEGDLISITSTTYFLDIVHRIILSYLIYQTISSFRKFNK